MINRERSIKSSLSEPKIEAAIRILTDWNGSRAVMAWSVDKFPQHAAEMLAEARNYLVNHESH